MEHADQGGGRKCTKVLGPFRRDGLNGNGEFLLRPAEKEKLPLVNTFFQTPKCGVSAIYHGLKGKNDQWRLDYIVTRQPHRRLVRTVKVHPVVRIESDNHIVSAAVSQLGRFARIDLSVPRNGLPRWTTVGSSMILPYATS